MSNALSMQVLVLNKGWVPVGTISVQRAIIMLFSEYEDGQPRAKIIDPASYSMFTWADWAKLRPRATDEVIRSANIAFRCPEVILLTKYEKIPKPRTHFSRRSLYKRDGYRCQYCFCRPGSEELTIDHVLPRSKGGLTTWENCVLACIDCNTKKADRTLEECGMVLRTQPQRPKLNLFRADTIKRVKSWEAFLGIAYWETPLQNDM